jgi:hypothetical protein
MYFVQRGVVELFCGTTKQLYCTVSSKEYMGLETLFLRTARHWCSALTRQYCDIHILPIDSFYLLLHDFPNEIFKIRAKAEEILAHF